MQITLNLPDDLTQLDRATLTQEIAIALLQQQHITYDQAAQLAGISDSAFQQLLNSRNIDVNIDVSEAIADDPDDDPEELILESIRVSLQQIREGKTIPISELWDGIDV